MIHISITLFLSIISIYVTDRALSNASTNIRRTHQNTLFDRSNLSRIAYLDNTNTPMIIDTTGTLIDRLDQYPSSTDLLWYDNTLVILQYNELHFYGTAIQQPDSLFAVFPPNNSFTSVDAIAIDNNLNMAYTYRYQVPYSSTSPLRRCYSGVAMVWADSSINNTGYEVYDGY